MSISSRIVTSTAVAFACAVALHAQTPTSSQANATIPGEITLTGCVERADQMAGSTTAVTNVDSLTFMLIHAEKGTAAEVQPTGTSGTKEDAKGRSYRLDADVATLNPHVGHKVEVTGTIDAATAPAAESAEPLSAANAPRLKIAHVKMVSETCAR
jgi:hypothetical protein